MKTGRKSLSLLKMPEERIELSPHCWDGILSPARLPVPPLGRDELTNYSRSWARREMADAELD
jgi:hypothetical protein